MHEIRNPRIRSQSKNLDASSFLSYFKFFHKILDSKMMSRQCVSGQNGRYIIGPCSERHRGRPTVQRRPYTGEDLYRGYLGWGTTWYFYISASHGVHSYRASLAGKVGGRGGRIIELKEAPSKCRLDWKLLLSPTASSHRQLLPQREREWKEGEIFLCCLKGKCHGMFCFRFFSLNHRPPRPRK